MIHKEFPKLFIGAVSFNVLDAVISYANENNYVLGIVVSRRQADWHNGYINNTRTLKYYIRSRTNNVVLERDHAGPNQSLGNKTTAEIKHGRDTGIYSLKEDSAYFDLIHIDPFFFAKNIGEAASITALLINWCLENGFQGKFEVGTESAICHYTSNSLENFLHKLDSYDILNYVEYIVTQSGPQIQNGNKNDGVYSNKCTNMVFIAKRFGLKSKEHNCDYLESSDIAELFRLGIDSINIAPEFSAIETKCVLDNIEEKDIDMWYDLCLTGNQWKRWFNNKRPQSKRQLIETVGHYFFGTEQYLKLKSKAKAENPDIQDLIKRRIEQILSINSITT